MTGQACSQPDWPHRLGRAAVSGACLVALAGCGGPQSALQPGGRESREISELFWLMSASGLLIWLLVMALLVYALKSGAHGERTASTVVWMGGIVIPCTVLTALLFHALPLMPALRGVEASHRIEVEGLQYWWRVRHVLPDGRRVETANEIHLPLGRRTEVLLTSNDVIHSFWIPSLAGKMDMIPGRTNRLVLEPERPGVYRGACAELCGTSHAFMALDAHVLTEADYEAWLARQAEPAVLVATLQAKRGEALFESTGCGACHAIRGTANEGALGPDLTHVGGRKTIAAGLLPTNVGTLGGWIAESQHLKPGNRMPSLGILPGEDLRALAAYLAALK